MVTDNTSDSKWTLLGKNADINSQAPNIVLSPGHTRGNLEKCKKELELIKSKILDLDNPDTPIEFKEVL